MATTTPGADMAPKTKRARYFALLVLACLMFAGQGTAIKSVSGKLSPIQIVFLPFCAATILLLPLLDWKRLARLSRGDWGRLIVAGVVGQMLAQLGMVWGIRLSLASNAAILGLMLPVISTILAAVVLREKITGLRVLALGIGLLGVILLSAGNIRQSSFLEMHYLSGNMLILAGLSASAFYNVYCKGLFGRLGQINVLVLSYIPAALASLPLLLSVAPLPEGALKELSVQSWVALGYQALVTYSAAMLLLFYALKHLDVAVVSLGLYLLPVFGVLLAATLLGERLSALALCGVAVVLLSTVLIAHYDGKVKESGVSPES
jgi:drug/metabolite transporter (DMT)-like permease